MSLENLQETLLARIVQLRMNARNWSANGFAQIAVILASQFFSPARMTRYIPRQRWNHCGPSMTNSELRAIYFKYNRSIHWPICHGCFEGDARGVRAPLFPSWRKGERRRDSVANTRCNPYNVTPTRARNSNIMDSASPHARCIYRCCIVDSSPRC